MINVGQCSPLVENHGQLLMLSLLTHSYLVLGSAGVLFNALVKHVATNTRGLFYLSAGVCVHGAVTLFYLLYVYFQV